MRLVVFTVLAGLIPDRRRGAVLPDRGTTGHIAGCRLSDAAIAARVGIQPDGPARVERGTRPTHGQRLRRRRHHARPAALNTAEQASTVLARCLHVPVSAVDGAFGMGSRRVAAHRRGDLAVLRRSRRQRRCGELGGRRGPEPAGRRGRRARSSRTRPCSPPVTSPSCRPCCPTPSGRWPARLRHRHRAARRRPGARRPRPVTVAGFQIARIANETGRPRPSSPRPRRCSTGGCRPRSAR